MPEKGWNSITVRRETAMRVRELAKERGLTMDELINELMRPFWKGVWSTARARLGGILTLTIMEISPVPFLRFKASYSLKILK